MNSWQLFHQLKFSLQAATWAGGAPTLQKVFGAQSVVVCADVPEDFLGRVRLPCALIRIQDATGDAEHDEEPDLLLQTFDVTVAVANPNDPFGESAFLGGGRPSPTASAGKGLLEVEEQLWSTIKSLGEGNGVRIYERGKGQAAGTPHPNLGYIVWRTYRFEAEVGAVRFYHPARKLAATAPGGGVASLSWTTAPPRFDYRRQILRRASGSTAPSSPTTGTGIALGGSPDGITATTKSDSPGAGTWSYSLWCCYDEYSTGTDSQFSASATKTVVVT